MVVKSFWYTKFKIKFSIHTTNYETLNTDIIRFVQQNRQTNHNSCSDFDIMYAKICIDDATTYYKVNYTQKRIKPTHSTTIHISIQERQFSPQKIFSHQSVRCLRRFWCEFVYIIIKIRITIFDIAMPLVGCVTKFSLSKGIWKCWRGRNRIGHYFYQT